MAAIASNPASAHSTGFGVASETLSHVAEGTSRQIISDRSTIRANNPNMACSLLTSLANPLRFSEDNLNQ